MYSPQRHAHRCAIPQHDIHAFTSHDASSPPPHRQVRILQASIVRATPRDARMIGLARDSLTPAARFIMQAFPHHYAVTATAEGRDDVTLSSERLPSIMTAPPAEFDGPGDLWSPEASRG